MHLCHLDHCAAGGRSGRSLLTGAHAQCADPGRTLPRSFLGAAISDTLVNPERNTRQLADKLAAAGVPVTLRFYDRVDHITLTGAFARPLRWMAPVLEDVAGFVKGAP